MKKVKYTIALCALLLPGITMAAGFTWVNWAGNQDWADGGNWNQAAAVPSTADETHINQGPGVPGPIVSTAGAETGRVIIDGGSSLTVAAGGNLNNTGQHLAGNGAGSVNNHTSVSGTYSVGTQFGLGAANGGAGSLTVNSGGTVTSTGSWLISGWQAGATGDITVDGGVLNAAFLHVGWSGAGSLTLDNGASVTSSGAMNVAVDPTATGLVEINGGVLTVAGLNAGASTGSATITLNGGQLINSGGFVQNANSIFNIGAGELIFGSSTVADVNWAIDNGAGTWNFAGANGNVRSVTDDGLGTITVTAIPEPATMGLVALFGGAVLGYRRFFR